MAELSAKEQLEAMIAGTHVDDESIVEDEGVNEEEIEEVETETEDTTEEIETDDNEDENEDIEDTDLNEDASDEDETEGEDDDSDQETSEDEEESQEEDAQAEETSEDESENTDDKEESDDERYMYNGVNVKDFFEKVALAKFTANGKEVEGFKDPEDLIRAQQMLHGYSDKMKVFKEYKPFIKALQERELTKDADKFNLAMSLLDGDTEAIKKVLKDKEIDPLDLDLENVQYTPKNNLPSDAQMIIEDSYEQAENLGIADKFNRVISKDWDIDSLKEFVNNGAVRNDLLKHIENGTYDNVQREINKMELLDSSGSLSGMTSIEKYRIAMGRLNQANAEVVKPVQDEPKIVKPEVPSIAEKEAEEFKKKAAAKKEAEAAEARKKAASLSKKKTVKKTKPKPRMEELKGDDFRNAFQQMLMG